MLPHSLYRGNHLVQRDTVGTDEGICQADLPSYRQVSLGRERAPRENTSKFTATTAAGVSSTTPLTPPAPFFPSACIVDERREYKETFLVSSAHTNECMGEAWRLHNCCCTEQLLRRIIELECENELFRIALLEGSERRMRQRFCGGFSTDSSQRHQHNHNRQQQQQKVLQCVREVERSAKRYFQDELEKMQQKNKADAAAAVQHPTRGETYESTLAQSERRRWKEHVRHTVEELALLHREKEKQAAGAAMASIMDTALATNRHHSRDADDDDGGNAGKCIVDLQREVAHWKGEAEKERARAELYREHALRELGHMHAIYRHALGEEQSTLPGCDAVTMPAEGIGAKETSCRADQLQTPVDVNAAPPPVKITTPTRIEAGEDTQTACHDSLLHTTTTTSPFFLSRIKSRSPVRVDMEAPVAAVGMPGAKVGSGDTTAPSPVAPQTGLRRSYHSDIFLRRESVTNDGGACLHIKF
ncbi:hypothetical protein TcG_07550 [Trypanosoma cruzi]|nr:hypothetical protein TcG_07550 [Trypanosoma cruzi]